jgi:hypothetical protein
VVARNLWAKVALNDCVVTLSADLLVTIIALRTKVPYRRASGNQKLAGKSSLVPNIANSKLPKEVLVLLSLHASYQ